MIKALKGKFESADGGGSLEHGVLAIEIKNGKYFDAELNSKLIVQEALVTKEIKNIEITCKETLYVFYPYDGECEKYGIEVVMLNDK